VVEADHVKNTGQARLAADYGKLSAGVLERFVNAKEHGEAAAVNIRGVGQIYYEALFTTC